MQGPTTLSKFVIQQLHHRPDAGKLAALGRYFDVAGSAENVERAVIDHAQPQPDGIAESNAGDTAGIVVTNPTMVRVEPTAFRCSTLSRSAKSSAIPAPIIARVAMMNANSGRESWISFTQKSR